MATEIKKIKANIIFKEKDYNRFIEGVVLSNNNSSGKIQVPKSLINKKVGIVWLEENDEKKVDPEQKKRR